MNDQKLFNHMADEHGLLLLESQMREIIYIVEETHETMDYQKLYRHIAIEHGLFLLDSQMEEIVDIVLEMHNENPEKCTTNSQSNPHTMKTAMQELHNWAVDKWSDPSRLISLYEVVNKIGEMIEKENKQLEKAWQDGAENAKIKEKRGVLQQNLWRTMKTPVKELYERLWETDKDKFTWIAILNDILEKEKEQIINAYKEGCSDSILDKSTDAVRAEQYYNETYKEQ